MKEPDFQILIQYKGGKDIQDRRTRDDEVCLGLTRKGTPERLASAVVNFPEIEGKRNPYIHEITERKESGVLLEAIEESAKERGYDTLYLNTRRVGMRFWKRYGFVPAGHEMFTVKKDIRR